MPFLNFLKLTDAVDKSYFGYLNDVGSSPTLSVTVIGRICSSAVEHQKKSLVVLCSVSFLLYTGAVELRYFDFESGGRGFEIRAERWWRFASGKSAWLVRMSNPALVARPQDSSVVRAPKRSLSPFALFF